MKRIRDKTRVCVVCGNIKHYAKGLCDKHYHEKYITDNPNKRLEWMMNYFTKIGKSFDMNSSEYSFANVSWRNTIKKRDNHTCQICNIIGNSSNIHAHHIFFKSLYPKLSLNINNGISLCISCHSELHMFKMY